MRCARTNNHTVREAACACIAELAAKIGADAVAPHASAMLRTLLSCLRDDSWPVGFLTLSSCFALPHPPDILCCLASTALLASNAPLGLCAASARGLQVRPCSLAAAEC